MSADLGKNVVDIAELRDRIYVFRDRAHAGKAVAGMLEEYRDTDALVLGIPAGGLPVAAVIAEELNLRLDVAVVSKITLPWNTEAGYGAVAAAALGLSKGLDNVTFAFMRGEKEGKNWKQILEEIIQVITLYPPYYGDMIKGLLEGKKATEENTEATKENADAIEEQEDKENETVFRIYLLDEEDYGQAFVRLIKEEGLWLISSVTCVAND